LKSELIFTDAPDGGSSNNAIPGRLEDSTWSQGLPEIDVEFAAGELSADQALLDEALGHIHYLAGPKGAPLLEKGGSC
jgi:hypothetical protein